MSSECTCIISVCVFGGNGSMQILPSRLQLVGPAGSAVSVLRPKHWKQACPHANMAVILHVYLNVNQTV
jgi:hypothetical protein